MKQINPLRSALPVTLLALAACAQPADDAPDSNETMMPVEPDGGIGDGAGPPTDSVAEGIPAALQGRWGLVPADCTSTRGDAKGLIEIDGESITFYESRAVLEEVETSQPTMIAARFAFTGEGQEWTRDMTWRLSDDRSQLVRSETGADALAEPLTYMKCDAEGDDA